MQRPVKLSENPGAIVVSLGLSYAARPHIYFYPWRDVSLTVLIEYDRCTIILIAIRVWVFPRPC